MARKKIRNSLARAETEIQAESRTKDFLCNTAGLRLAEASRDTAWGVGMTLTDPKVLDPEAWPKDGNILRNALEKICKELLTGKKPPRK